MKHRKKKKKIGIKETLFPTNLYRQLYNGLNCQLIISSSQVRHSPDFYECNIKHEPSKDDKNEDCLVVHLNEDDQGLAAGQFAAFYRGDTCLGSGIISNTSDGKTFPICSRALELAKLEDKSKLGKPVRIINL